MKRENTSDRLKIIMAERNLKQVDILELVKPYCIQYGVKIGKSALSQYISGKNEPKSDKVAVLALALNVSEAWLMGYDVPREREYHDDISSYKNIYPIKKKLVPMLGDVACGEPIFADQQYDTYVEADSNIKADFCIRCKGKSMIGDGINDGDMVFIRKQDIVENGEIACVIVNNEATLKHVYISDDNITLIASNPSVAPMVYGEHDVGTIKILGKAVALSRIL